MPNESPHGATNFAGGSAKVKLLLFSALTLHAQVDVYMNLMGGAGAAAQLGKGIGAYTWNVAVCAAGPTPVPFVKVRMGFPEVRIYSKEQALDILNARVNRSLAKRVVTWGGYGTATVGIAVQYKNTQNKSSSQLGTGLTVGGLAIPLIVTLASNSVPKYQISNFPPDVIALPVGGCAEYTVLAAFGTAPNVIPPRRIEGIK
jgi:hypothetical protein